MRVDIYDDDTKALLAGNADLAESLGDDVAAVEDTAGNILDYGYCLVGGGAAPLVAMVPAGTPADSPVFEWLEYR